MSLLAKLFGKKSLSALSPAELRKEEILATKARDRLMKKLETIAADKQRIFQNGAKQKSPELRRALAQEFELRTREELMIGRELNVRSKELLTVSRVRMVKENREHGRGRGRLNVSARDVARINAWIEDDTVSQDLYTQKLDAILEAGGDSDSAALGATALSQTGQELLALWDQLDRGKVKPERAYDQADAAARKSAQTGEQS
jgi:hypothetical protein